MTDYNPFMEITKSLQNKAQAYLTVKARVMKKEDEKTGGSMLGKKKKKAADLIAAKKEEEYIEGTTQDERDKAAQEEARRKEEEEQHRKEYMSAQEKREKMSQQLKKASEWYNSAAQDKARVTALLHARDPEEVLRIKEKAERQLRTAAYNGDLELLKLAISRGIDINAPHRETETELSLNGWTALHKAVNENKKDIVLALVEAGADLDVKDNDRRTPLHLAAIHKRMEILQILSEVGAFLDVKDWYGKTALHHAAEKKQEEMIEILLENRASTEIKDKHGKLPIHYAAQYGYHEIVRRLLEAGCSLNPYDKEYKTPYHYAADSYRKKVMNVIDDAQRARTINPKSGLGPLHAAILEVQDAAAKRLLKQGALPNMADFLGRTALHCCALRGNIVLAQDCLDHDCNIDARDNAGYTAIHHAAELADEKMVSFLIGSGAKLLLPENKENLTPLELAYNRNKKRPTPARRRVCDLLFEAQKIDSAMSDGQARILEKMHNLHASSVGYDAILDDDEEATEMKKLIAKREQKTAKKTSQQRREDVVKKNKRVSIG